MMTLVIISLNVGSFRVDCSVSGSVPKVCIELLARQGLQKVSSLHWTKQTLEFLIFETFARGTPLVVLIKCCWFTLVVFGVRQCFPWVLWNWQNRIFPAAPSAYLWHKSWRVEKRLLSPKREEPTNQQKVCFYVHLCHFHKFHSFFDRFGQHCPL